jgi:small subunit ribosomal protein S1
MSWSKKMKKASTIVEPGESVDAVILAVNADERRISLGLKQALGDPWAEVTRRFPVGSVIEGPVTSLMKFGAFVQLAEGVEGMIHISDMSAEKRLNHPQEMLKVGQAVRAQVLEIDTERRRLRLGMKQLVPTSLEEYIAEHKQGDVVTGRMLEVFDAEARVELAEGVQGTCRLGAAEAVKGAAAPAESKTDLSSLTSMLQARWKGAANSGAPKREAAHAGQVRSFRITQVDPAAKKIALELAE